ncbi:hypothetical protein F7984_09045 [Pradoshia sp. D12]|uniref:hypothetical protein n=1 Tax=Bacillaceae TaxID=186817 RepID=UPI00080AD7E2|nr:MULTISPECIES: hypothetical protein [Bacillaceae]OCA86860.1 hypothetical protein A8L44_06175 [Bacillus sp. FJAT-27986]QFK71368.1 hypothetical protein F7984_09045 [Pradoshia sp. D12]TPF73163.1 hypothetical protein FHY44_05440 [Bacillus sp. D12]
MTKKQDKKKSKWLSLLILIVGILAAGVIGLTVYYHLNDPSKEAMDQLKKNPPKNISNQESVLIAEYHAKYNDLTGYGSIEELDMSEAKSLSAILEKDTNEIISQGIENKKVSEDFKQIHAIAKATKNKADKEQIRLIHRYFHDLDIAINQYNDTKDVFGVTKTLGK